MSLQDVFYIVMTVDKDDNIIIHTNYSKFKLEEEAQNFAKTLAKLGADYRYLVCKITPISVAGIQTVVVQRFNNE